MTDETADTGADPAADFAALMSAAAAQAQPAEKDYGVTIDRQTGETRAKRAAGRPRKSPPVEELKAEREAGDAEAPASPDEDRPPVMPKRGFRKAPSGDLGKSDSAIPQHRPGVITRGMNKRYRQVGKMARALDQDTGQAFIVMATNTSDAPDEDDSVGAAWDEVARVNPRVRKFCLLVIQGGAYGALVMAHVPLALAIAMKFVSKDPGFFGRVITSMAEPDEDTPPGEGGLLGGMTEADVQQLMAMAGTLLPNMGRAPAPGAASERAPAA